MKNAITFKVCPECESGNIVRQAELFLCLDCKFSVNEAIGYDPMQIIEIKRLLDSKCIHESAFVHFILKNNTVTFPNRMLFIEKFVNGQEQQLIFDIIQRYKDQFEAIMTETIEIDDETLIRNREKAHEFFTTFGATALSTYFKNKDFLPAVGREQEIVKIERTLKKRNRSCVAIIGPSGSGTTHLALSVAQRILANEVQGFTDSPVWKIDSAFINCSKYTGDLEKMVKDIISHAKASKAILIFDDAEQLTGQGTTITDHLDVADKLFTVIYGMPMIFVTSEDKYQEKLSQKLAFAKTTEIVRIDALSLDVTKEILQVVAHQFYLENKTRFSDAVLDQVNVLSSHIRNRALPDRSIALLEKISVSCKPKEKYAIYDVTREDIIQVLVSEFQIRFIEDADYRQKLALLPNELKKKIIGQDEAIDVISAELIKRDFRRKELQNKPLVVYFTGPTGVGKTVLAITVAEVLFGNKAAFFRLDMSQMNDFSSISYLTGNSNQPDSDFIKWAKNYRTGLLLLDEFEKAPNIIKNLFLPIFDQGHFSTPKGEKIYFSDMIICITSNAITQSPGQFGFSKNNEIDLHTELARFMAPELVNRIQNVVLFNALTPDNCIEIVRKIAQETTCTFEGKGISLTFTDSLYQLVADQGYSLKFNARKIERVWDQLVLSKLANFFFSTNAKKWHIDVDESFKITINTNEI
jgi:ATP-dependent Clp protease ATP-binding subunit ClpA